MSTETNVVVVGVERGAVDGAVITCEGCADQEPGKRPGDLHVVLVQAPHDVYERKGAHLLVKRKVSLIDALCGVEFHLKHPSGHSIAVSSPAGEVITPSCTAYVENMGMPIRNTSQKGHLFVQFDVAFPARLTDAQRAVLLKTLGRQQPKSSSPTCADEHHHEMSMCSPPGEFTDHRRRATSPTSGDGGVQCAQS
jgi:DnaJ family protein A protein 2